ncbi:hypothetical protein IAU60_005240 [Kwoniella sp. DSM 27419]
MPLPHSLPSLSPVHIQPSPPTPSVVPPTAPLLGHLDDSAKHTTNGCGTPERGHLKERSPSPAGSPSTGRTSPLNRSPTHGPLSPDLPSRDALYLFSNFSSYMQSAAEGGQGIKSEEFKDTIRLLEHARLLASHATANVHVLHVKYRFQNQAHAFRSPYITGESSRKSRIPVPQPFSVLHDPVLKIDYMENGIFDPLPAQAVFSHIAKICQPPPRIIVISYVYSRVIENHLASLSQWAMTSVPPCYIFSPVETRIREPNPLHLALHHAIPMSMYAWPRDDSDTPSLVTDSPQSYGAALLSSPGAAAGAAHVNYPVTSQAVDPAQGSSMSDHAPVLFTRRLSRQSTGLNRAIAQTVGPEHQAEGIRADPVAALTVVGSSSSSRSRPTLTISSSEHIGVTSMASTSSQRSNAVAPLTSVSCIPLWHLAPGVGILHGSISASIGVKLSDFSALNLADGETSDSPTLPKGIVREVKRSDVHGLGIKTSPFRVNDLTDPMNLLEKPISWPSSTTPAVCIPGQSRSRGRDVETNPNNTIECDPRRLGGSASGTADGVGSAQSWPPPVTTIPGWRSGRKETMEDTLEELGIITSCGEVDPAMVESKESSGSVDRKDGSRQDARRSPGKLHRDKPNILDLLIDD